MAEEFVELGAEGINYIVDNHFEKIYDAGGKGWQKIRRGKRGSKDSYNTDTNNYGTNEQSRETTTQTVKAENQNPSNQQQGYSQVSGRQRKQRNRLPSPEPGDNNSPQPWNQRSRESNRRATEGNYSTAAWENQSYRSSNRRNTQQQPRSPSLDRESQQSEQVIRAYEADPRDPPARPETVLKKKDLKKLRRDSRMSYANGYAGTGLQAPYDSRRPHSQQPTKSRYYDDDDSDYDERSGRRYRTTGRGYDDGYDDDRDYDREVVTTERYRGPARQAPDRRESYGTSRSYGDNAGGGAGTMTQYNRRSEVDDYQSNKRSRSRGRRDRDTKSRRSSSGSRSRSRSRSRSHSGIRGKLDEHFDTSMQGIGVGLAGAIAGGLAGREFGHRHKQRDILLGALIGGLGANAAENKWRDWKDEKKRDVEREEEKWEGGYGRSRSAMR